MEDKRAIDISIPLFTAVRDLCAGYAEECPSTSIGCAHTYLTVRVTQPTNRENWTASIQEEVRRFTSAVVNPYAPH